MSTKQSILGHAPLLMRKFLVFLRTFSPAWAENRCFGSMTRLGAPLTGRAAPGSAVASAPAGACYATLHIPGAWGGRS